MKIINLYGILVRSIKEIYALTQTFLFLQMTRLIIKNSHETSKSSFLIFLLYIYLLKSHVCDPKQIFIYFS